MSLNCKGCKDATACTFQHKGSVAINECPCGTCLIKGICVTACEAMNKHYENTNMAHIKPLIRKVKRET